MAVKYCVWVQLNWKEGGFDLERNSEMKDADGGQTICCFCGARILAVVSKTSPLKKMLDFNWK